MMARGSGRPVVLIADARRATGEIRFQHWDRAARLRRAAKAWVVLWALAVVSVLIPVAHFILVPAFFIAGPITALGRFRQENGILGGSGPCPACGGRVVIEAHDDDWPFFDICGLCRASVRIEAVGAQQALP